LQKFVIIVVLALVIVALEMQIGFFLEELLTNVIECKIVITICGGDSSPAYANA